MGPTGLHGFYEPFCVDRVLQKVTYGHDPSGFPHFKTHPTRYQSLAFAQPMNRFHGFLFHFGGLLKRVEFPELVLRKLTWQLRISAFAGKLHEDLPSILRLLFCFI